jgi:CHAT domain-containing protein
MSPAEKAREDSLARVIAQLEQESDVYSQAAGEDTTADSARKAEECRTELVSAQAEWSKFQQEIADKYPVTEGQAFPLDRIQMTIPGDAAIIGWIDQGFRNEGFDSWGYVIRKAGPVAWARLPFLGPDAKKADPYQKMESYRYELTGSGSPEIGVTRDAQRVWAERFEPLVGALGGVTELIVIPSGAMLGIPLESLRDKNGIFLGDRFAISYTPSATIFAWLTERAAARTPRRAGGALLVGDPPFTDAQRAAMESEEKGETLLAASQTLPVEETLRSALAGNAEALASLPRLQGSRAEVLAVASVSPHATLLVGPDASEQELVRLAQANALLDFSTIHLATHALVDDERPEESALVLSQVNLPDPVESAMMGTRIYDGLVTAKEIIRDWRLDADLVTLSACDTGLGKRLAGEGYIGFAHVFLQAGARSLLVSLWKVDDEATSLLMRRFYENLYGAYGDERAGRTGASMPKAQALQEAKRWLRDYVDQYGEKPYSHPYYWSAFILIGDRGNQGMLELH